MSRDVPESSAAAHGWASLGETTPRAESGILAAGGVRKFEAEGVTLYLDDCMEIMPTLARVDALIGDPPYGTTACAWDCAVSLADLWRLCRGLLKRNAAVVLTASQPFTSSLVMSNPAWFKYCWVWEKSKASNFLWADYMPLKAHEDIAVFSEGPVAYNPAGNRMAYYPQKLAGKAYDKGVEKRLRIPGVFSGGWSESGAVKLLNESGDRNPRSVIYFRTAESEGNHHPTQKPVDLMAYLVATYSQPGETVLDPFMGSGTTGLACVRTGRKFIGIERDPVHFETAVRRISAELAQGVLSLGGGGGFSPENLSSAEAEPNEQ